MSEENFYGMSELISAKGLEMIQPGNAPILQATGFKHPKLRKFRLDVNHINSIEDIKKILHTMNITMFSNDPLWEEIGQYFTTESVPRGYFKLLRKIGAKEIAKLDYYQIEEECNKILKNEKTN